MESTLYSDSETRWFGLYHHYNTTFWILKGGYGARSQRCFLCFSYCYVARCLLTVEIVTSQCLSARDAVLIACYFTSLISVCLNVVKTILPQSNNDKVTPVWGSVHFRRVRRRVFCLSHQKRLNYILDIWGKEYKGVAKCTGWPFRDLDPRSRLWHRLEKFDSLHDIVWEPLIRSLQNILDGDRGDFRRI